MSGPGDGDWPRDDPDDDRERPPGQHDTDPLPILSRRISPAPRAVRRTPRGAIKPPFLEAGEILDDAVDLTPEGDPVPSPMVRRYLFSTERFVGEWRRHWTLLWREMAAVIASTFLLGYVAGLSSSPSMLVGATSVLWGAILFWAAWKVGDWYFDRFVLTSRRVMVVSGMVTRKVAMMPLARVTDMAYNQGPIGRILNYGTFVLESAGQDQALREIIHLPNPRELYLLMVEEMYGPDPNPRPTRTRTRRDTTSGGD
jgi:membrane protein YdbS with pleckstrin-like domain